MAESFTEFTENAFGAFIESPVRERGPGLKPCPNYLGPRDGYGPNFVGLKNSFDITLQVDLSGNTVTGGDIAGAARPDRDNSYAIDIASPALNPGAYAGHFSINTQGLPVGGFFRQRLIFNITDLAGDQGTQQMWPIVAVSPEQPGPDFNRVWGPIDPTTGIIVPANQRGPVSGIEDRDYDKIFGFTCPFKVFCFLGTPWKVTNPGPGQLLIVDYPTFDFEIAAHRIY